MKEETKWIIFVIFVAPAMLILLAVFAFVSAFEIVGDGLSQSDLLSVAVVYLVGEMAYYLVVYPWLKAIQRTYFSDNSHYQHNRGDE